MTRSPQEKGLTGAGTQVYTKQQRRTRLHRKRPQSRNLHGARTGIPVAVASLLEKDKPNKVTLLGRDYVVWYADDMWNAAKDECPHRRAHLSRIASTATPSHHQKAGLFTYRQPHWL